MSIVKPLIEKNNKVNVIFMGTPEFAVPGLNSLINSNNFKVIAVYTKADKAIGRKQIISESAIKKIALKHKIKVFQPEKIKLELDNIKNLKPDLIVVIAYGKIIPPEILTLPKYGCINVHASLLPKYRGAACLNAPILNGDKESGITIMEMDAGLDTGPIIKQFPIKIDENDNLETIHDKLANLSAKNLIPTLESWIKGEIKTTKQNDSLATYVKILSKEDGKMDIKKSALELTRMIKAFNPWPGSYFLLDDKILKIIEAEEIKTIHENNKKIGEIYQENKQLQIKCGQNSLNILRLQLAGKKVMNAKEFLNGHNNIVGKNSKLKGLFV